MTEKEIKSKFYIAFTEMKDELKKVKGELTELLEEFISTSKEEVKNEKTLYLINSPESRIKNEDHFWGKLVRNGYIEKWKPEESSDYKELLRENLTDLIGLRLLCYFEIDENEIYDKLDAFLHENDCFSELNPDAVDKTIVGTLTDDHIFINKIQGKYKAETGERYCFEIQVKSLINDLWGEVDHEIIYKAKQYQYNSDSTKELSTNIHQNLRSSDRQLHELLNQIYTEPQLLHSLFYLKTEILAFGTDKKDKINHIYHQFFNFFYTEEDEKRINDFVGNKILDANKDIPLYKKSIRRDKLIDFFTDKILIQYFTNDLKDVKQIAKLLFEYEKDDLFYLHIANNLFKPYIEAIAEKDDDDDDDLDPPIYNSSKLNEDLDSFPAITNDSDLKERFEKTFGGIEMLPDFSNFQASEKIQIQASYILFVQNLVKEN